MGLLCRRHFWSVQLLFTLGVMLLLARTGNALVEAALLPLPAKARHEPRARRTSEPTPALEPERLSRLTGLALWEPTRPTADPGAPLARSSLRLRLLGTLLAGLPEYSVASLQDCVTLKSQTLMIGDQVQNAEALEIERARVIVFNDDRREFVDSTCGEGGSVAAVAARSSSVAAPSMALGSSIKETRANEYAVPRAERDKILANLAVVAAEARIVPTFTGGVAQGFRVLSIRPDSVYTKIGIQNGDVIRRINGYELNSPENGLEIYLKLRESSRIEIEVDRNGSSVRNTYDVQ